MKIILILSAVLLIKQSLGGPVDTSTSLTPAGEAFRNAIIAKFAAFAEEPIKLGKKLMEDTFADQDTRIPDDNFIGFVLKIYTKGFEKFDLDKDSSKIEAFLGYITLFDLINGEVIVDELARQWYQEVKVEFDKHNIKGVANVIKLKFDEFLAWLTQELETKSDKLPAHEQLRMKMFQGLCQRFKEETDLTKKDALSGDIIALVK